ncbi:MAG: autotransporter domain-containing protein [Thiohalomonadales bacterium]
MIMLLQMTTAYATLTNASVGTAQGVELPIDLVGNISDIVEMPPVVTVASQPSGTNTATATICSTSGLSTCITYKPAADFVGVDTFTYAVVNDAGVTETATVTVSVAGATDPSSGIAPITEVEQTLTVACGLEPLDPEAQTACDIFNSIPLDSPDGRIMLEAITPAEVAAQLTLGDAMAQGQLGNIAKYLRALRKGQRLVSVGGLAIYQDGETLTGDMLADLFSGDSSGGAASADSGNSRWGWFINGNIGGGKQDETDYENGFDFDMNGVSSGVDYRFSSSGIIGAAIGYSSTAMDLLYGQGGTDATGLSYIGYGSFYPSQNSYVDVILSANNNSFESQRRIVFGSNDDVAYSENDSLAFALSIAGGFNVIQGSSFTATIDGKLETIKSTIDGYTETGTSDFNVTIEDRDSSQFSTAIGSIMTYAISTANVVFLPQLDIFWVHQFEEDADLIEGAYNFSRETTAFSFNANAPDTDYFRLNIGLSAVTLGGNTGYVQLGSTFSRADYQNWLLALGWRLEL